MNNRIKDEMKDGMKGRLQGISNKFESQRKLTAEMKEAQVKL